MKMKFLSFAVVGMIAMFNSSCTAPSASAVNMETLKPEIQKMEDAYAAAEKAKDADGVVAYYSDDAISYGRGKEPLSGKAAIKEHTAQELAKDTTGNTNVYKVVDLFAEGNMAVEIGSWTKMSPSGAELQKGHYLSYFQKRDGKYVCVRDMNVSSTPDKPAM